MTNHRALRLLIGAASLAALVTPAAASASTAEVVGGDLRLTAGAGEANEAGVLRNQAGDFAFYDNNGHAKAGAGCRLSPQDKNETICPAAGVTRITVSLGDRNDTFEVDAAVPPLSYSGGSGADAVDYVGEPELGPASISLDNQANDGREGRDNISSDVESIGGSFANDTLVAGLKPVFIDGRDGDDKMTGGPGNDYITAAYVSESGLDVGTRYPQGLDTIACGGGNDQVFADKRDVVAKDCEVVARPAKSYDDYNYTGSRRADHITVLQYVHAIVRARGGNDVVRLKGGANGSVFGGAGNDDLRGESGQDKLSGGPGRDTIRSRDHSADKVTCGSGRDTVIADKRDKVARDCERVRRG